MKTSKTTFLTLVSILMVGFIYSCQSNKSKQTDVVENEIAIERAQVEMNNLKQQLDTISESDPAFADKLEIALDNFNDSIDNISDELSNGTSDAHIQMKQNLDGLHEKGKDLKSSLREWKDRTENNMEELAQKVRNEYYNFKESLNKQTN